MDSNYGASFHMNDKSYLMQVKVKGENSKDAHLKQTIAAIVNQVVSSGQQLEGGQALSIEFKEGKVFYAIGASAPVEYQKEASALLVEKAVADQAIQIVKLSTKTFSRQGIKASFIHTKQRLLAKRPAHIPLISLFWNYALVPLIAGFKVALGNRAIDLSPLKNQQEKGHRFALEEALNEVVDLLEGDLDPETQAMALSFKEGLYFTKQWRENENERQAISANMVKALLESPRSDSLLSFPAGQWREDGSFQPSLYSFFVDQNTKELCLTEMTYGAVEDRPHRTFTFKERDPQKLQALLFNLLSLTLKPDAQKSDKEKTSQSERELYGQFYLHLLPGQNEQAPQDMAAFTQQADDIASLPLHLFKEQLCIAAGGELQPDLQSDLQSDRPSDSPSHFLIASRRAVNEDPLKLVHEVICQQFPEAALKDKALFSLQVLYSRLNKVIEALPDLTAQEKQVQLLHLEQGYQSFERQLSKANLNAKEIESSFLQLGTQLKAFKEALDVSLKKNEKRGAAEQRLEQVSSRKCALKIAASKEKKEVAAANLATTRLSSDDYLKIAKIENHFLAISAGDQKSLEPLTQSLKSVNERIDQLISGKQYELAKALYQKVIPFLPAPDKVTLKEEIAESAAESVTPSFWRTLGSLDSAALDGASSQNSDLVKQFSDQIGQLSHHFWEASLKTGCQPLSIEDRLHLMNSQASLLQALEIRASLLQQKKEPLSLEEETFLAAASVYDYQLEQSAITHPLPEKYLRHLENPHMATAYERVQNYLHHFYEGRKKVSKMGDLPQEKTHKVEIGCCQAILDVAQKRGIKIDDKMTAEKLHLHYLQRFPTQKEALPVSIPSQLADLSRHQLLMSSLLYPQTAISHSTLVFSGALKAVKQGFTSLIKGRDYKDISVVKNNFKDALAEIAKLDRLEIKINPNLKAKKDFVPSFANPDFSATIEWGITSRKASFNAPYKIAIDIDGSTDLQRLASINDKKEVAEIYHRDREAALVGHLKSKSLPDEEARALYAAVSSDEKDPLDLFFVEMLRKSPSPFNSSKFRFAIAPENKANDYLVIHQIFDLIVQRPWVLNSTRKNEKGVESLEALKIMHQALFSSNHQKVVLTKETDQGREMSAIDQNHSLLAEALQKSPEFFLAHADSLKMLLETLIKEEKEEAFFLLYLLQTVHAYAEESLKEPPVAHAGPLSAEKREILEKAVAAWPSFHNLPLLSKALALSSKAGLIQAQMDRAAYITSFFANSLPSDLSSAEAAVKFGDPLQKKETLAHLLKMGSLLTIGKQEASLPIVGENGLSWVKERLSPYIASLEEKERNEIFNSWCSLEGIDNSEKDSTWTPVANSPFTWKKGTVTVDLLALQLLDEGKEYQGIQLQLPLEICDHADYQTVFGSRSFSAKMTIGKEAGDAIYSFTDKGRTYRLSFNRVSHSLTMEQRLNQSGKEKEIWLRFTPFKPISSPGNSENLLESKSKFALVRELISPSPKNGEKKEIALSGIEKVLQQRGMWLEDDQHGEAYLTASDNINIDNEESSPLKVKIALQGDGQIERLTLEGDEIVIAADSEKKLPLLKGLPEQLLLLKKGKSPLSEIRFFNQPFSLKRKDKHSPWLLSGGQSGLKTGLKADLKGDWKWVLPSQKGENRPFSHQLVRPIASSIEETGFMLQQIASDSKRGGQTALFLWPIAVKGEKNDLQNMSPDMSQSMSHNMSQNNSPLQVLISEEGQVTSSTAGYLQLAYLLAQNKAYGQAAYYLQKAKQSKVANAQELETIAQIGTFFSQMESSSTRSAALKLKGILAASAIIKEGAQDVSLQSEKPLFTHAIAEAFQVYSQSVLSSPFEEKKSFIEKEGEIALTAEEMEQIKAANIHAFFKQFEDKKLLALKTAELATLQLPLASKADRQLVGSRLVLAMERPFKNHQKSSDLLDHLKLDESTVIGHFFELYNLILSEKLTVKDLLVFMTPIPGLDQGTEKEDKSSFSLASLLTPKVGNSFQQLDSARKILLSLAALSDAEKEAIAPIDLKQVRKLQAKIPTSLLTLALAKVKDFSLAAFKKRFKMEHKPLIAELNSFLEKIHVLDNSSDEENRGKVVTLNGIEKSNPKASLADLLKMSEKIALDRLKGHLQEDESLFGPAISQLLVNLLESEEMQQLAEKGAGFISKQQLTAFVEKATEINLMTLLREKELEQRIPELEEKQQKKAAQKEGEKTPLKMAPLTFSEEQLPPFKNPKISSEGGLWQTVASKTEQETLSHLQKEIDEALTGGQEKGVKEASTPLTQGIDSAQAMLQLKLQERCTLKVGHLPALIREIEDETKLCQERLNVRHRQLISHLIANRDALPSSLQLAVEQIEEIGEMEVLQRLKFAYQMNQIADLQTCQLFTCYLLEKAAGKVLEGKVQEQLQMLVALKEQGYREEDPAWIHSVTTIKKLTVQALSFDRYLENGQLKNESLYRKVLALEAQLGIILSSEQLDLIAKMAANPTQWYELKVGLGKTSVVFPIVLLLLIEQGKRPAALVKEELFQQNLESLDSATRDLLANAGVAFSFRLKDKHSSISLAEQYMRLLEVSENQGYPITTISSLIDLDHQLQLLEEELQIRLDKRVNKRDSGSDEIDNAANNEEEIKEEFAIDELRKQIYYLSKIRAHFDLILIDEADDILNIISERNVGRGDLASLNGTIQKTMQALMQTIFTAEAEPLKRLKKALIAGQQAALPPKWIEEELFPSLVAHLLKENPLYSSLKEKLNEEEYAALLQELTAQICSFKGEKKETPKDFFAKLSPEEKEKIEEKIGALKHIIQGNLKVALGQNPGIDVGLKSSDGFQIGPQVSGQEKIGTVFGDEYDLIVNHYLYYGVQLPERLPTQKEGEGFVDRALNQIKAQHPDIYQKWVRAAQGKELLTFMNEPANLAHRLDFLRLQLFEEQRLKRFERQIVYNVQDIGYGRQIGGMTGTLNRFALPSLKGGETQAKEEGRQVVAQVLLEAGILGAPTVNVVADDEQKVIEQLIACAKNQENKALINQGFALKQGNTQELIALLRQQASERIFVYVDSVDRKTYIWRPQEKQSALVSKAELNQMAIDDPVFKAKSCFYFGPPDTRGTDFRIPPGNGVTFVSAKCSMDDFIQSLGRMRGAGHIHRTDFFISEGAAERIQERSQKMAKPPVPSLSSISYGSLVNDIAEQEREQLRSKNLKSAIEGLKRFAKRGTHQLLYSQPLNLNELSPTQAALMQELEGLLHQKIRQVAADPQTGWLEEVKKVSLKEDFAPSFEEETSVFIKKIYKLEKGKIAALEKVIEEFLQEIDSALIEDKETREKLQDWRNARLQVLNDELGKMKGGLTSAYQSLDAALKLPGDDTYPKKVPSSGANLPTAQAQVQEVQQTQQQSQQQSQQQTQQQSQQTQSIGKANADDQPIGDYPYLSHEFMHLYHKYIYKPVKSLEEAKKYGPHMLFFREALSLNGSREVEVTSNLAQIFPLIFDCKSNESFYYFLVKEGQVTILTKADYVRLKDSNYDAVYSLVNPDVYGKSVVLNRQREDLAEDPLSSEVLEQMVKAKWLLGMIHYSKEEKELLKKWFKEIAEVKPSILSPTPLTALHQQLMEEAATKEQYALFQELQLELKEGI